MPRVSWARQKAEHLSSKVQGSQYQLSPSIGFLHQLQCSGDTRFLVSRGLSELMCGTDLAEPGPVLRPAG